MTRLPDEPRGAHETLELGRELTPGERLCLDALLAHTSPERPYMTAWELTESVDWRLGLARLCTGTLRKLERLGLVADHWPDRWCLEEHGAQFAEQLPSERLRVGVGA